CICHIRPSRLVESWSVLKAALVDVENEALTIFIQSQGLPWDRKQPIAHAQKTANGQDCVSNSPRRDVEHYVFDRAHFFIQAIVNRVLGKRTGGQHSSVLSGGVGDYVFCIVRHRKVNSFDHMLPTRSDRVSASEAMFWYCSKACAATLEESSPAWNFQT